MKQRILVVEDEEIVLNFMRTLLEKFGYEVFTVSDGLQGLAFIETRGNEIDLIISDVEMPVMNGVEMLKRIRVIRPDMPVIVTSGYSDIHGEVLKNGADAFLRKPARIQEIIKTITEVMESRKGRK